MIDWDDAYDNRGHIPDAMTYPPKWEMEAKAFRDKMLSGNQADIDLAYGSDEREVLDIFHPKPEPNGLVVFVHGGYWRTFDKSYWSHLASGSLEHGWAFCFPSYSLVPNVRISEITLQIAEAIKFSASKIEGPIRLVGHSAGGHLVTRMLCAGTPLPRALKSRLVHTVSISGVHDLRPLLHTKMNEDFQLDEAEAVAESPALLEPDTPLSLTCWVGADERPEFVRQNDLLKESWAKPEIDIKVVRDPGKHHFSVVEDLAISNSPLSNELMRQVG